VPRRIDPGSRRRKGAGRSRSNPGRAGHPPRRAADRELIAVTQRLQSFDPAHGRLVWEGDVADAAACGAALDKAHAAFPAWARTPLEERVAVAERYAGLVKA
ncbi:hypothetical protein CN633_31930, partial [Bacillus toyonensis]